MFLIICADQSLQKDEYSRYSFHDAQKLIEQYRKDRILRYKHMYPAIVKPHEHSKKGRGTSTEASSYSSS